MSSGDNGTSCRSNKPSSRKRRNIVIYWLQTFDTKQIFYIGITNNPQKRLSQHRQAACCEDRKISRKIKKLLRNNRKIELVEIKSFKSRKEACEAEIKYIKYFKNKGVHLYNSTTGGENEYKITDEVKKKISKSHKENWKNDKKRRKEYSERMRKLHEKYSFKGESHPLYGKKRPEVGEKNKKTKSKKVLQFDFKGNLVKEFYSVRQAAREMGISHFSILEVCKGRLQMCYNSIWRFDGDKFDKFKFDPKKLKHKPVAQFSKSGKLIKEYDSMMDASKEMNISHSSISACCRGKQKSCGGFIWKYKGLD